MIADLKNIFIYSHLQNCPTVSLVLNFKILLTNGEYFLSISSECQRDTFGSALLCPSGTGKSQSLLQARANVRTAISIILFGC